MTDAPLDDCGAPPGGRAVWLRADDGLRLRLVHWPGARHLLILTGRTEYAEKYGLVARDLAAAGWGAVVVDWRGQGRSDRLTADARLGDVPDFAAYQLDLRAVRDWVAQDLGQSLPVLAHSMGGLIALRAVAGGWRVPALALAAPMLGLPLAPHLRLSARMLAVLGRPFGLDRRYAPGTGPDFGLASMQAAENKLTSDPDQFSRLRAQIADPGLHIGGPSLRWTAAALSEVAAIARCPAPDIPALIGLGGQDQVIDPAPVRALAARWPGATLVEYPDARHELLMERPAIRDDFLRRVLALFTKTGL